LEERDMKIHRLLIALTIVNLGLMVWGLAQIRPGRAEVAGPLSPDGVGPLTAEEVAPVLRGRALEIVDDRGRVRASIKVYPADPTVKMPDGTTGYPETVLIRLINSKGRPNVKIDASETGAGVMVGGESDPTYASLSARGANPSLKMINKDGVQQTLKP
jgi:hypothetical protein